MLKTLNTKSVKPKEGRAGVGSDSRAGYNKDELDERKAGDDEVDDEFDDEVEKKDLKTSKSKNLFKNLSKSKKMVESDFFTFGAKLALPNLGKYFLRLQSSTTLIWNVISGLKRMYQAMLLVESSVS